MQRSISLTERGLANLSVSAGMVYAEPQEDLDTLADRMEIYSAMRSDGTVAALERILSLPVAAVEWTIEAESGQKRAAKIMSRNLFGGMTNSWNEVMHHVMLACLYGFCPFEKVWEERDGLILLKKLAPKDPATTYKWHFDETGGLRGWEQEGYRIIDGTAQTAYAFIPVDKLLVFTYDGEFGNPEGRGMLRPAYRPWYMKDKLLTFAGIKCEREACGTPIGKWSDDAPPGTISEHAIDSLQAVAARIRVHESGGVALPQYAQLENFSLGPGNVPFLDLIEYCDTAILKCGLAQFIGLGQGENTGAFALSRDQSSTFKMVLDSIVNWASAIFNKYLIPQWYQYNWGEAEVYPRLKCGQVGMRDAATFVKMLSDLYSPYMDVGRRPDLEKYLCDLLGLPEPPKDGTPPPRVTEQRPGPQSGPAGKPNPLEQK